MDEKSGLSRRSLIKMGAAGGMALSAANVLAACGGGGTAAQTNADADAQGTPRKGGQLRIALNNGTPADTLDPSLAFTSASQFLVYQVFDQVNQRNADFVMQNRLAEEFTPNKDATEWTVRLRKGVEFHDGKSLTADDLVFTLKRIFGQPGPSAWLQHFVDSVKKVDPLTARVKLKSPVGWFDVAMGDSGLNVVLPEGFDPKKPVGTGAWKLEKFRPGQEAVLVKNPNYWDGEPHLDRVSVLIINDDPARLNALVAGQVEVVSAIAYQQVASVPQGNGIRVWNSPTGRLVPMIMRMDVDPFKDVRVRQALRLCLDRKAVVDQAFVGHAAEAADVYGIYDPRGTTLKREQDLEQARALLKQAGQSDLNVQLVTSRDLYPGSVEQAQILAQNASEIGATVKVRIVDGATLYGPNWLSWHFSGDNDPALGYMSESAFDCSPHSPINRSHWKDAEYAALWEKANAAVDDKERTDLIRQMQQIQFDRGTYIIPAFPNQVGAYSDKVGGWPEQDVRGFGLGIDLRLAYFRA